MQLIGEQQTPAPSDRTSLTSMGLSIALHPEALDCQIADRGADRWLRTLLRVWIRQPTSIYAPASEQQSPQCPGGLQSGGDSTTVANCTRQTH